MILVGTDPLYGTMYNHYTGKPIITVPGQNVAVKSGTAQIADEKMEGYLVGSTNYIFSVVTMNPAENPDFILYVTVQQPEHYSGIQLGEFATPILERASAMKESLNLQSPAKNLDKVTTESSYAMPSIKDISPGELAEALRRNIVQPIVVGTGTRLKRLLQKKGPILHQTNKFSFYRIRRNSRHVWLGKRDCRDLSNGWILNWNLKVQVPLFRSKMFGLIQLSKTLKN